MIDEGYTKFNIVWTQSEPLPLVEIDELIRWRRPLFDARLIGEYQDLGIGFGNLSVRYGTSGDFLISGTQTGHLPILGNEHFSRVTNYDLERNSVSCVGPVQASSESMTHAAIYSLNPLIRAVVHVHSADLWLRLKDSVPTTAADVAYGTPEMALEFGRLYRDSSFAADGVAVMAGHEEGLLAIGSDMRQAANRMLALIAD